MGRKAVVGFFSVDERSCYEWLIAFLLNSSLVKDVRPVYIPNCDVIHEAHHCTFAVLYHTKNRGRLNITDVVDSLYDQELQTLNRLLGRENVIVVVDDLEDVGNDVKTQILQNQPSIGSYARDLFLFRSAHSSGNCQRNLQEIRNIIQAHDGSLSRMNVREIYGSHPFLCTLCLGLLFLLLFILIVFVPLAVIYNHQNPSPLTTASPWNTSATATATTIAPATRLNHTKGA